MYYRGSFKQAVMKASNRLHGSYALGIVCSDDPGRIFVVREASPLILGVGIGENYFASDVTAMVTYTRNVIYLEDGEFAPAGRSPNPSAGLPGTSRQRKKAGMSTLCSRRSWSSPGQPRLH